MSLPGIRLAALDFMRRIDVRAIAAIAVCGVTGCTTTRQVWPPPTPATVPAAHSLVPMRHPQPKPGPPGESELPEDVPRVASASPAGLELAYPSGARALLPPGESLFVVRTNAGMGAAEGAAGGLLLSLVAAVRVADDARCESGSDCTAAAVVSVIIGTALGALFGVLRGHTTTYVYRAPP
jgi:hypothetical protein